MSARPAGLLALLGLGFLGVGCGSGTSEDSAASGGTSSSTGPTVQGGSVGSDQGTTGSMSVAGGATGTSGTVTNPTTEPFEVAAMTIDVDGGASITSKDDYVGCTVSIDGKGSFSNFKGIASIRGRGNSTWLWYDKKPYRIKLSEKAGLLGLKEDKDWVLLANYRDPTFLMNAFAFQVADWLGLPFTNHSRFVEVTLNGSYIGLYQLTEQVEQGANRVNVADDGGILLSLDEDDGPTMAPTATDNFVSTVYQLPVCVKYPENQTVAQLGEIQADFAKVEQAMESADYGVLAQVLDIGSLIDFLILQELTYNVELVTPRSMYLHKDSGGVYVLGPVWDFDGGFDFDWTDMMTSHDYFAEQPLVMGSDPARNESVSKFWVNLFTNAQFVTEYKARWAAVKDTLMTTNWAVMDNYETSLAGALGRNAERWPIGKDYSTEFATLKQWLETRMGLLTTTIAGYPAQ